MEEDPKRQKVTEHRREPAPLLWWYVVGCGFFAIIVMFFAGFSYLRHLQNEQIKSERAVAAAKADADRKAEQQRVANLHVICTWASDTRDYYAGVGSDSAARLAQHWEDLRRIAGCDQLQGGK